MDNPQLHATERPGHEVKSDHQAEHDPESEAFLSGTWRQAREDEILVLGGAETDSMHQRRFDGLGEWIWWSRQCCLLASDHMRQALLRPEDFVKRLKRHPKVFHQRLMDFC